MVWHRNSLGEMWAWNGSGWNQLPGQALDISGAADGTACRVSLDNHLYRWVGGQIETSNSPQNSTDAFSLERICPSRLFPEVNAERADAFGRRPTTGSTGRGCVLGSNVHARRPPSGAFT
ncbi:MAG: hypothetical protein JWR24_2506 [Actinoallomurus sp.]|nr:hypothetical protein [Actinoallomurus sp.]